MDRGARVRRRRGRSRGRAGAADQGLAAQQEEINDAKLALIEGLSRAKTEAARATLEKIAVDRAQGDEVQQAAAAALDGARRATGEQPAEHKAIGEWRMHLMARISLDFVLLARATTTVDVASGLLDSAIDRFRDGVRQVVSQDGKLQLVFTADGPMINGTIVTYGPLHDAVAPVVTAAMRVRDAPAPSATPDAERQLLRRRSTGSWPSSCRDCETSAYAMALMLVNCMRAEAAAERTGWS